MHLLRRLATSALLALSLLNLATLTAHAVTIDWVTVGDPGNANDTTGFGGVGYSYQIGKYEVTIQQYTDFLNAAAKSDPYGFYTPTMSSGTAVAGIVQSGSSGAYTYSVVGPFGTTPAGANSPGDRPISQVSWWSAARFTNWMQNGQGNGSTETGAYTIVGGQTSGTTPARNPGASFYIPTENEWYKAAYYSPLLNAGSGGYYLYPTLSNAVPGNVIGSGSNQANYSIGLNFYSVTQASGFDPNQNYLTNVGAFTNSASFYGTFDQGGNVREWSDTDGTGADFQPQRGGAFNVNEGSLRSTTRSLAASGSRNNFIGFRLGAPVPVPEPSTWALGLAGLTLGGLGLRRRRHSS